MHPLAKIAAALQADRHPERAKEAVRLARVQLDGATARRRALASAVPHQPRMQTARARPRRCAAR